MIGILIRIVAFFAMAGVAVLLFLAVLVFFVFDGRDPFDRFEVVRVTSEPGSNRHAVTYRYDHANSSNRVLGTWIVAGSSPSIGSTNPPPGAPVLIWTGASEELDQKWVEGHLAVSTKTHTEIRRGTMSDCYFEERVKRLLCIETKTVEFVE